MASSALRKVPAALAMLVLLASLPAIAEVHGGTGDLEIYGGYNWPDDIDSDWTFGLRIGGNPSDNVGIQGSVGYLETEDSLNGTRVDFDIVFFDLSVQYFFNPEDRAVWLLYGGPGWAWVDSDFQGADFSDDTFTLHAGLGVEFAAGESWFVRPDAKLRWLEDGGDFDWEATVSLGWRWGD